MPTTRRRFLEVLPVVAAAGSGHAAKGVIDRRALVARHNPRVTTFDALTPLTVGNGEFAFTADPTGLQTFPELYEDGIPLCTQSQWGWHSTPAPGGLSEKDLRLEMFDTYGRRVGYPTSARGQEALFNWLRENPHRLHLGRIGLTFPGSAVRPGDLHAVRQTLDLWTGVLESNFELEGVAVTVRTSVDPAQDAVAFRIASRLWASGRLAVAIEFPYGSPAMNAADWRSPERHRTEVAAGAGGAQLARQLDQDRYHVSIAWRGAAGLRREGEHRFTLATRPGAGEVELVCRFSPSPTAGAPLRAPEVERRSAEHWRRFWSSGGAVDFSGSPDPRASELERRVVLSQYLTAVQCAGSLPPQETGLTCNSWYGKFHLEMHWWHAAHFPLWGRTPLLERSLDWYLRILPSAREKARSQGYTGARWPKMTAPDGRDSPSTIGPLLIWQQPHPIAFAELCYQSHPDRRTLERYHEMVFESAEFMASFAAYDARRNRFNLGPPVIPAQENHPPRETWNPVYELAYWAAGLETAQLWRERLGLGRNSIWERVRRQLAELPRRDGVYLAHENCPQTFTERNRDHPSMLMALGVLDGAGVDRTVMRNTLRKVMSSWRWEDTWGWDYPMIAMTAARLGETRLAIDALFLETPKNGWLANGHNYQRSGLPLYLPANGGLLTAVALMAAGWRGGPKTPAPGFPAEGWRVRFEGLHPFL